jgi:DNA-binding HxlR family transcriptional regulator
MLGAAATLVVSTDFLTEEKVRFSRPVIAEIGFKWCRTIIIKSLAEGPAVAAPLARATKGNLQSILRHRLRRASEATPS